MNIFSLKNQLLLLLVVLLSQPSVAQNYQAEYAEFGTLNHGTAVLTFNANSWLYQMAYMQEERISSDNIYIPENERKSEFGIHLLNYYSLDKGEYLWELIPAGNKVMVKEPLEVLDWEVRNDSTKEIGGYHCVMAECHLCGWEIQAWFAPEIPVSCGPWRLWGLPGLIVKAFSRDGDIDIQMTSLKAADTAPVAPDLSGRKVISKAEFAGLAKENAKRLARILNNSQERDAAVDIEVGYKNPDKCF